MIVKPSITFLTTDSDPVLIADVTTIITAMTDNPSYPDPDPVLSEVQTALDNFSTSLANAAGGGVTLTAIKDNDRDILAGLVRDLASYVQVACKGDLSVLMSSGFPIQKPQRFSIGALATPANLKLKLGPVSGSLIAITPPVYGASSYNWRLSAASAPAGVLQTGQTTGGRMVFTGLTPGQVYNVQSNAVGTAGATDWSNPVSLMVV